MNNNEKLQTRYEAAVADLGFRDGSLEAQLLWDYTLAVKELLADQPAATETRCHECHMTSQHKLQCSRRNEPLADQPAATETQAGVCPNCGYGPVIALPAPAATENKCPYCPHPNTEHRDGFCSKCECGGYFVIAEPAARRTPERCPDCLRLDGQPHATTCKQYERW